MPANLLGPLCSSSKAFLARLSMARLFSRTWLCVCRSSSSLHDFKLAVRYFLQDSVDVIASFSWGLSGGLHATSMSSSTRFCALVTHLSCRPSRNAASTRAIVLRSWICSWLLCAARRWWRSRDRIVGAIQALASWSLFRSVFRTASPASTVPARTPASVTSAALPSSFCSAGASFCQSFKRMRAVFSS